MLPEKGSEYTKVKHVIGNNHVEVAKKHGMKCTMKWNNGKRQWSSKAFLQGTCEQNHVSTHKDHSQRDSVHHQNPPGVEMGFEEKDATLLLAA